MRLASAQAGAAPDALVQRMRFERAAHAVDHRKAQRQAQGRIEAEHGQCLAQVVDAAPAGVQRGIGHAQHACAQRHVHADDVGRGGHVDVGVLRQLDDAQRHARRRGQVAAVVQGGLEVWLHGSSPTVIASIQPRSLSWARHAVQSPRCNAGAMGAGKPGRHLVFSGSGTRICSVAAGCIRRACRRPGGKQRCASA